MDFYIPIPFRFHAVNSQSFPFSFPCLSLVSITMEFPLGLSHSYPIPKHGPQNNKVQMQTVHRRATKTFPENWPLIGEA